MRANGPAVCNAACACSRARACAMYCIGIRVHVLPAVLTCVRGGTKGERAERRRRNGETRCGTHSLSMGHSHSLDREGNSAAVLNPANWRNSTTEQPPRARFTLLSLRVLSHPPVTLPITFPFLPTRLHGPSLSLPSLERCITRRSSIYGYGIDFCNGDFTARLAVEPL